MPQTYTLHLLASEQNLFSALPVTLQSQCTVVVETNESYETKDELLMRYQMASLSSSETQRICKLAKEATDGEGIEKAAASIDLRSIPPHELGELFFTLGARWTDVIVKNLLENLQEDDLEGVAALTQLRHSLFETNADSPSRS